MPLICAPNLWNKISKITKNKNLPLGCIMMELILILIVLKHLMKLSETFLKNNFVKENYLDEHKLDNLIINKYQSFIKSIIIKYKKILSK